MIRTAEPTPAVLRDYSDMTKFAVAPTSAEDQELADAQTTVPADRQEPNYIMKGEVP